MSAPDAAALDAAIQAKDAARVRDLLKDATGKERRTLLETVGSIQEPREWLREAGRFGGHLLLRDNLAWVAFLIGCGDQREALAALRAGPWHGSLDSRDWDVLADVLMGRKPAWARQLLTRKMVGRYEGGIWSWPLARRLVRRGVISMADFDGYATTMIYALAQTPPHRTEFSWTGPGSVPSVAQLAEDFAAEFGNGAGRLAQVLLDDPGLLDDEVWQLFTTPGVGREMKATAYYEYVPFGDQWADALVMLVGQGHLNRDRLIDASLDAFLRDLPPNHLTWYVTVHDKLAPTADEKVARTDRYLALLSAPGKPGILLGQRTCAELLDAGQLDVTAFLAASQPVLIHPQKSIATTQLKRIGKIAASHESDIRAAALAAAAQAFAHPREDLQAAALKLIAKHGLPAAGPQRDAIIELSAFLSPVLRPEAAALGLAADKAAERGPLTEVPAAPVPTAQPVIPVTDPEELVQLLAGLMEDTSDPIAVERALDGAVRLSVLPLPDRAKHAKPLLNRVHELTGFGDDDLFADMEPFSGYDPALDMAALARTWATGDMPPSRQSPDPYSMVRGKNRHAATPRISGAILSARGWEACGQIADGNGYPLLATPEFEDGSISHDTLLSRLAQWPGQGPRPPRTDVEVAMLRLAPGAEALLPADLLTAYAPAQAARSLAVRVISPRPGQWSGAGKPAVFARYEPAGQAISKTASQAGYLLTDLHPDMRFDPWYNSVTTVAELPLFFPYQPDLLRAHLLAAVSHGLVPGGNAAATALSALTRLPAPLGPIGHAVVVTGLAGAEPETRIAAADAWLQLTHQGCLEPAVAADIIVEGIRGGAYKPNRLAEGFRYASLDPAAAGATAQACVAAAAALLEDQDKPAGLHLLLEAAANAGAIAGLPAPPSPITDVASGKSRTKLAEAARRLVALSLR